MKTAFTSLLFIVIITQSLLSRGQALHLSSCKETLASNADFSKGKELQTALDEIVKQGIPGVSMAVYSMEGWWASSAGFFKIEDQTPMHTCHLQFLQSVTKTYLSVGILKLTPVKF